MTHIDNDTKWLIKTIEWICDPKSNGGISTCKTHKGHGFVSDCAVCNRMEKIKKKAV